LKTHLCQGKMVEALKTAREELSPLTLNDPTLVDALKATMGSIAAPLQGDALQAEQLELASRLHTALAVRTPATRGRGERGGRGRPAYSPCPPQERMYRA
jgi:hypothetical protein